MTYVLVHLLHPHGWWILADVVVLGVTTTVALLFADAAVND